jgi:hypothetical protein
MLPTQSLQQGGSSISTTASATIQTELRTRGLKQNFITYLLGRWQTKDSFSALNNLDHLDEAFFVNNWRKGKSRGIWE